MPWHKGAVAPKTNKRITTAVVKKVQTISTVAGLVAVRSLPNVHSANPLRMLPEKLLSSPSVRRTLWTSDRPPDWTGLN